MEDYDKQLGTELVIYDKRNRCLIKAGEYELVMREMSPTPITRSPHKSVLAHWETLKEVKMRILLNLCID